MLKYPSDNGASKKDDKKPRPLQPRGENIQADLEVKSSEVQEIIGRPPHWLVRGGIAGFLVVLALIFSAASFIKYPEVITAPLQLTAVNAPITLESKINGKLVNLLYENKAEVEQGDILAWIESTASHEKVLTLSAKVDSIYHWLQENDIQRIRSIGIDSFTDLGELQSSYQNFEQVYREYVMYLPGGFYNRQKQILEQELQYLQELLGKLKEKKQIQKINLQLSEKEYQAQKKLAEQDLVAPLELSRAESEVAASRLPFQQTESEIINNRISQTAKRRELMELDKQIVEQQSVFRQALNTLESAIDEWKNDYLITSPISGTLVYGSILQENQTVSAGQRIAYIQPDSTEYFGQMIVSQQSFGKVGEGQKVLVRFSGYPDQEFGSVTGTIDYFSSFPVQDSVFLAKVDFPKGLKTNYDRKLPPTNGMVGEAEIITQDMRFIERIYNNLTRELR